MLLFCAHFILKSVTFLFIVSKKWTTHSIVETALFFFFKEDKSILINITIANCANIKRAWNTMYGWNIYSNNQNPFFMDSPVKYKGIIPNNKTKRAKHISTLWYGWKNPQLKKIENWLTHLWISNWTFDIHSKENTTF